MTQATPTIEPADLLAQLDHAAPAPRIEAGRRAYQVAKRATDLVLGAALLAVASPVMLPDGAYLHFSFATAFEDPNWDGGVIEYSSNGGPWTDAGSLFDAGGYNVRH